MEKWCTVSVTPMKLSALSVVSRWGGWSLAVGMGVGVANASPVDFRRDIQPILSDNCFACHGPDTQKVKSGLRLDQRDLALKAAKSGKFAVVPGKPAESELIQRILTEDADDLMPPGETHKVLTAAQKELLQRWIAEGADYPRHWAYVPPVRPAVPAGSQAIDFLVRQRLAEVGLKPSAEADRRTLGRRLGFDLAGLPLTAEEVTTLVKDAAPDAYARCVERLLASPRYGERMAIGWLDVVRFADTVGYHSDTPRDIWPYRDYVIRSFNQNKPFDQFTREQLAGDLLPGESLENKVGSAFNRLLLTTEEGGAQEKDYESRYLTDRVRAVGSVWLGQTIGCAQCHDHKFDPIKARDFYSMGAFFADIKEPIIGARGPGAFIPSEQQAPELERHAALVAALQKEYDAPHPELADALARWLTEQTVALEGETSWSRLHPEEINSAGGATGKIRENHSVLMSGPKPDTDTYTLRFTNAPAALVGLRLEVLPDDALPHKGPGRAENGNFVLTEIVARVERAGTLVRPVAFQSARASLEQSILAEGNPYGRWSAASAIDHDVKGTNAGWAILLDIGRAQQLQVELAGPLSLDPAETLVVELQQNHGNGSHTLGCFRLGASTNREALRAPMVPSPPKEIAELLRMPSEKRTAEQVQKLQNAFNAQAPQLAGLRQKLADVRKARSEFQAMVPRCLVTERNDTPRTVRILPRGNWMVETGEIVEPALPGFLVATSAPASKKLNRLDLATWLVSPENPLTARVVMNRLWKQFFGVGLSKVLDDLGSQGEPPVNPALLDWLAVEFRESGWDLKHMVRLIVMSDTYRQVSIAPRELLTRDPDNRELARQSRWRLDAEFVRDNALSIAGLLAPEIGGPSVRPYQPDGYWENLNFPVRNYEPSAGAGLYRRGLYVWWQRSYVHPSLLAFDAPTREECAVERNRSNIPQQALVLLNDPTYVEAARALAVRILQEGGADDSARFHWAWLRALGRAPRAEELATLRPLLAKHLAEYRQNPGAAEAYLKVGAAVPPAGLDPAELAAWTNLARTLLNLHETITRS